MNAHESSLDASGRSDFGLTVIRRSPDPEHDDTESRLRPSLGDRIQAMGQSRLGALLLLIATVVAIVWANVSYSSYEQVWGTHLVIGVEDLQLNFTLHGFVNDAIFATTRLMPKRWRSLPCPPSSSTVCGTPAPLTQPRSSAPSGQQPRRWP